MQRDPLNNIHIQSEQVMITPAQLKEKLPISDQALAFVQGARTTIADIIHHRDHRLLVILWTLFHPRHGRRQRVRNQTQSAA